MAGKENKGGVVLTDHNTGKTHNFVNAEAAAKAYEKINEKDNARGFPPNYSVHDADGNLVASNNIAA